jgi:hypothetical protein
MSRRTQLAALSLLLVAVASVAVTACGGASPRATGVNATATDNAVKFARCMREHGVNLPDPVPGKAAQIKIANPQALETAQSACARYREAVHITPAERAAHLQAALKFSRCMRSHGVNLPDPTVNGGGVGVTMKAGPGSVNPSSAVFEAAQKACQGLMGKSLPKGGALSLNSDKGGGPGKGPGGGAVVSIYGAPSGG